MKICRCPHTKIPDIKNTPLVTNKSIVVVNITSKIKEANLSILEANIVPSGISLCPSLSDIIIALAKVPLPVLIDIAIHGLS